MVVEADSKQGSGFFVKSDGTLVTNFHVVSKASDVAVRLPSGEVFRGGYLMAADESRDLAVLRVEAFDVPFIALGNSNDVKVGSPVLLLGAPRGLEQSVSDGIIAALRESDGTRLIQTSAAASPGSSGGPLLNESGEVVGILSFTITQSQNLNFAVPVNCVRGMIDRLAAVAAAPLKQFGARQLSSAPQKGVLDSAPPPRSREEAILKSNSLFVDTRDSRLAGGVSEQLLKWGRYTQVRLPERADLILQVEVSWENVYGSVKASAQLIDGRTSSVLWAITKGGITTDGRKAGRQVVEELEKLYRSLGR